MYIKYERKHTAAHVVLCRFLLLLLLVFIGGSLSFCACLSTGCALYLFGGRTKFISLKDLMKSLQIYIKMRCVVGCYGMLFLLLLIQKWIDVFLDISMIYENVNRLILGQTFSMNRNMSITRFRSDIFTKGDYKRWWRYKRTKACIWSINWPHHFPQNKVNGGLYAHLRAWVLSACEVNEKWWFNLI